MPTADRIPVADLLPKRRPIEPFPANGPPIREQVWAEAWEAKYRRKYIWSTNMGPKGELSQLTELWRSAPEDARELWFRHWVKSYLRDADRWLVERSHPILGLTSVRLNTYGEPKQAPSGVVKVAPPVEPPMPLESHKSQARALVAALSGKLALPAKASSAGGQSGR